MIGKLRHNLFPDVSNVIRHNAKYRFDSFFFLHLFQLFLCTGAIFVLGIEDSQGLHFGVVFLLTGFLFYMVTPVIYRKFLLFLIALVLIVLVSHWMIALGVLGFILFFTCLSYIPNKPILYLLAIVSGIGCMFLFKGYFVHPLISITVYYAAVFLMIRYIFFLYELNYFKEPPVFIDRLNYLFMLPNACFPLFSPVDPKIFVNEWYSVSANGLLQKGVVWITRGIFFTLIYRIVYIHIIPSPYEVENVWSLLLFLVTSFSLVIRMLGIFYIAFGILILFGFNLPAIFDNLFLAAGFTDFWRRVNMYWRAFVSRVFYYPMMRRMKKTPLRKAILICTLVMFTFSWLLHAWQWFWIKGWYNFAWNDILFWWILGTLIATSLYQKMNPKKHAVLTKKVITLKSSMFHGGKVILTLFAMSLLWSMWTADSLREWVYLITFAKHGSIGDYILLVGLIILLMLVAGFIHYAYSKYNWFAFVFMEQLPRLSFITALAICITASWIRFSDPYSGAGKIVVMNLNQRDRANMERGYYEELLNNESKQIQLMNLSGKLQVKWNLEAKAVKRTNNILLREFRPNVVTTFKGDSLTTNSLGMRDREYKIPKPANTVRIALLGGSYEMGSGVSNNQNYASRLENQYLNPSASGKQIEILNYGVGGYHLSQAVYNLQNKVEKMQVDYVFYVAHSNEISRALENLVGVIEKQATIQDPFLRSIIRKSGVKPDMLRLEKYNRLKPYARKIIEWGYGEIALWCKNKNAVPVWIYLPTSAEFREDPDRAFVKSIAQQLDFCILELTDVYKGYQPNAIQLSEWDAHPNQKGHAIIAKKLFEAMNSKKQVFDFMKN